MLHAEHTQAVCADVVAENMAMPCKIYRESAALNIRLSINIQEPSVMKFLLCSYKPSASVSLNS